MEDIFEQFGDIFGGAFGGGFGGGRSSRARTSRGSDIRITVKLAVFKFYIENRSDYLYYLTDVLFHLIMLSFRFKVLQHPILFL